jgi:hypothetical protein
MPHQVSTEANAAGVVISFSGAVSGSEVVDLNGRLASEESFSKCRYQLWDFSAATSLDISIEEIRAISLQDIAASAHNPNLKTAIVGHPSLFGGKDEIFLIFEEVWTAYKPKFFPDVASAKEWLSSDQT